MVRHTFVHARGVGYLTEERLSAGTRFVTPIRFHSLFAGR